MMKGMNALLWKSFFSCEGYANFVALGASLGDVV